MDSEDYSNWSYITKDGKFNGNEWVKKEVHRLIDGSTIRICKLYEITFALMLTIVIAWICGVQINAFLKRANKRLDELKTLTKIWYLVITLIFISLLSYYIPKFSRIFNPFLFLPMAEGYVPDKKGEFGAGSGLAMSIIFLSVATNLSALIQSLSRNLFPSKYDD